MSRVTSSARSLVLALSLVGYGAVGLFVAEPALGASFTVNTQADADDFDTADPFCDSDSVTAGSQCTLRAAIQQTNDQPGLDVVNLPAGTYTIDRPTFPQHTVTDELIIDGAGASSTIISQDGASRIFEVDAGTSLDLRDVTVRDGVLAADGAGIRNLGSLILRRSVVKNNQAIGAHGGGIYAGATATSTVVLDSVIGTAAEPNDAAGQGSGVSGGRGGGIAVETGTLEIRGSLVEGNESSEDTVQNFNGAGLYINQTGLPATIEDSTIRGNKANLGNGGGLHYVGGGVTDSLLIRRSTISGNQAETAGGGIVANGTSATILDSTISGNTAANGGAAFVDGTVAFTRSTIAGNSRSVAAPAGVRAGGGTSTFTATILENQNDENCGVLGGGTTVSGGASVDSGTTCSFPAGQSNLTPLLGALANNGGPTLTHALLSGSPAIDRLSGGLCSATDQRGAPRSSPVCDAGAYQRVFCRKVLVNRVGTAGSDLLMGTALADGILGLGGDDVLTGLTGKDGLCGGDGKDRLRGRGGKDRLAGGKGRDRLFGGRGRDRLAGGKGRDRLRGGRGQDFLNGGRAFDRCNGGAALDQATKCEQQSNIP